VRKFIHLLMILLIIIPLVLLAGCWGPKEVTVSVLVQESGPNSPPHSKWIWNVVSLAADEWNSEPMNKIKIKLDKVEHPSTPEGIKNTYNNVIKGKKPVAILGSPYSNVVFTLMEDIAESKIPYLTAATNEKITKSGNKAVFRVVTHDKTACKIAIKYVVNVLEKKKLAVLYTDNVFGQGAKDSIVEVASEMGGRVVKSLPYKPGGDKVDVRNQIEELKETDAEFLLIWPDVGEGVPILAQIKEKQYTIPFMVRNGILNLYADNLFSEIHNDSYLSLDFFRTAENMEWVVKVETKYGKDHVHFIPAAYYDGANILFNAIKSVSGKITPNSVREQLRKITYSGVLGDYRFDENGDSLKSSFIVQIKEERPELVKIEISE